MELTKDTYIVNLNCDFETTTPLLINLNSYELNTLQFIANLSDKLSKSGSHPYLSLEKFPTEEYKKHKLSSLKQEEYKEIVQDNKKAYNKIRNEIKKSIKKAPTQSSVKVE